MNTKEYSKMQKLTVSGNLGADPEEKFTSSGTPFTSFSVAATKRYRNSDGERIQETSWYRCSAWGNLGTVMKDLLHKGDSVIVEGEPSSYAFQGSDGDILHGINLRVRDFEVTSWKNKKSDVQDDEDEIPF